MNLPNLNRVSSSRSSMTTFGGLNETYSCGEAEFGEMKNFSSRGYPALRVRKPRAKVTNIENLNGMYNINGVLYIHGRDINYTNDDAGMTFERKNAVANSRKTMVAMGSMVLIWPDKVAYDTADNSLTKLEVTWDGEDKTVEIQPCDSGGNTYKVQSYGKEEPTNPTDGYVFLKVANAKIPWDAAGALEVYSADRAQWDTVTLNYCLVSGTGIGKGFNEGDTVTISESAAALMEQYTDFDGDYRIYAKTEDSIRIAGGVGGERFYGKVTQDGDYATWESLDGQQNRKYSADEMIEVQRRVPNLAYMTENNNRIWGCAKTGNVIYACKQGDPTNWFSYNGIASDSYAVTVGSEGMFTGAATCQGYTLFFKENCIHKIYGDRPATYQLVSTKCRGVANGAADSLKVINEVLFYVSTEGVMAWDGSLPVKMSAKIDDTLFAAVTAAQGGVLNTRYYLHITTKQQNRLLVYDTERATWHEEDVADSTDQNWMMCGTGRQLYCWKGGNTIWATDAERDDATSEQTEQDIEFCAVTGDLGVSTPEDKYISRITVRADAETRSVLKVQVSYDGGEWADIGSDTVLEKYERVNLPFIPTRCDTLRLRFSGTGRLAIRSVGLTLAASEGNRVQGAGPKR